MEQELWVHIAEEPEMLGELIERLEPGIRITTGEKPPPTPAYRILVAGVPDRDLVTASPELAAVIIPWSGVPKRTRSLMREFPAIAVHNLHHNAVQVAEMAVALLLAAAKRIVPVDRDLRAGDWTPRYERSRVVLLEGKHAVVLGHGAIGRSVVSLLTGLGMTVTAVCRGGAEPDASGADRETQGARPGAGGAGGETRTTVLPVSDLDRVLPTADALVICLPLTEETDGLIGERELSLMPPDAILVNVGRGPVVEEGALYRALRAGTLNAAGLDVWYNYPTGVEERTGTEPSAHPFRELDNVVMSPHRAGAPLTPETEALRMRHLAVLLNAAARGEAIPNRVNLELGY